MRNSITLFKEMKERGEKFAMLTAYDYSMARLLDDAGVPILLVGDSLGMVMLGYESTIPVTMDEMVHHIKAVVRGSSRAHVVGDLPFMTYQCCAEHALHNAARFMQEGGCQSVKLEGGETVAETVRRVVAAGIPVMGHIGLTPQSVNVLGGFKAQGKTPETAVRLVKDAIALEQAGAYAVVLEAVPAPLSRLITEKLSIPTVGIGAGPHCDGQVQVVNDILGLFRDFVPKHAKQYARLDEVIRGAVTGYLEEVRSQTFPTKKESFIMDEGVIAEVAKAVAS